FERSGDDASLARTLGLLAGLVHREGDVARAQDLDERALAIYRRIGDLSRVAGTLNRLGHYAVHREELARARTIYQECLDVARRLDLPHAIAATLANLGTVEASQGEDERAIALFEEAISVGRETGHRRNIAIALAGVSQPYLRLRRLVRAREALLECLDHVLELELRGVGVYALEVTAQLAMEIDRTRESLQLLGAADAIREALPLPRTPAANRSLAVVVASRPGTMASSAAEELRRSGRSLTLAESAALARRVLDALSDESV
ncbi:MAG: tetratricopeptide repeat protein, partial [Candidatus Eisenbacteria bacterium]|nr:tetratricopeptide repeat protein [Candidatus Eisenbacteria bacterium]